ncbi:breast cancer type 2 susceptibility protein homolog [Harpegnathos saltator]|uniref:breast cancer type 2 susceptibility protein homolog n=1 Tax=Harpegnathos saltator TaxID=610380 RepID=UPI000DBED464|nr:breast cancer type 2 susceptibility protein homolog [Harpegnathos saltator]
MSKTAKFGPDDGPTVTNSFTTNEDESDELFSDDEQSEVMNYKSDVSLDVSILRSKTPLLSTDNSNTVTPSDAVIPSTPLSLVPFLNKINEQWTSDLETPQANKSIQLCTKPPTDTGETPKPEQHTPDDISSAKSIDNKITSDSPIIVPRVVRKRPKRRCIFKSSTFTNTSAEASDEHATMNKQEEASHASESNINFIVQNNATDVTMTNLYIDSTREDNRSQFLDKIREMDDYKNFNHLSNDVPDTSDLAQEVFSDASFDCIDKLIINNLDKQATIDTNLQDISKQIFANSHRKKSQTLNLNKIEENKSTGFLTANGTAINISKEAMLKAETLLADEMQIENHELFDKKSSIEQKNKRLSLFSGALPQLPLTEHMRNFNKVHNKNCQQLVVSESLRKSSVLPLSLSTASTCSNVSEQALPRVKLSFMKDSDESLETNVTEKASLPSKTSLQEIKNLNIGFQTAPNCSTPINISKQALSRVKLIFANERDEPLKHDVAEEANIHNKENKQEMKSNIGFQTARGTPINISKQALTRAKLMFATELDEPLEPNVAEQANICDREVKEKNARSPSIGFQTARSAPINISKHALTRAKLLFAKELDEPLEANVVQEVNARDKEVKVQEVETPSVGFQTARGAPINISKQALTRAKLLFAKESDEPSEANVVQEVNTRNKEVKVQEVEPPNVGFQTARGAPINISKQALTRAKLLFAKELDEPSEAIVVQEVNTRDKEVKLQEVEPPNVGFQTARGAPINISKRALTRAKLLFAKELDEPLEANIVQEVNTRDKEVKVQEVELPNVGFQTARGASINTSKQALFKAKLLFARELDEPLEHDVAEKINISNREIEIQEAKTPGTDEFQTALGTSINISKQALSKAKLLFTKEFDGPSGFNLAERANINSELVKEQEVRVSSVGFRTARGASISISKQAFSKAQALFADQLDSPTESNLPEKRKLTSDDSTPLGRGFAWGLKKVRLSNEFGGRKLFPDCSSADMDVNDTMKIQLDDDFRVASRMSTNDGRIETVPIAESPNEAAASRMEYPDERNQADPAMDVSVCSPQRDTSEFPESNTEGSPIIGRQPVSRKRWSLEYRRSKQSTSQLDDRTSPEDANSMATSPHREKTNEEESQRVTQPERQKAESTSESTEYGDTQMMMDFIDESAQILQDRLAAALEQENAITDKSRRRSRQSPGYLYRHKQINSGARVSLRDLADGAPPRPRTCQELIDQRIPPNILAISSATAASYKFRCSDFYGNDVARSNVRGIELEDGARLVMDENGYVGVWEFLRAFLASPGVEPSLVPARWIENHYRWIVWKLASLDRMKFGSAELPRALTPSHVMAQLKYRYDREIDRSQRPAIRRILEQDDVASKRMILCVSSIVESNAVANSTVEMGKSPRVGMSKWRIELTDGWYNIPACIDLAMIKYVSTGKVREGTKLLVYGAELLNCNVACYPLEAPADVCLKLHTNSTRRARWDLKLGYAPRSGPISVRLRDVCPNGGLIGKMTIVVARVYPMLYHEKTVSGESVLRNAKSEEKAQTEYEQRCRHKAEAFYDKAEKDFQEEDLSCETDLLAGKSRENSTQAFAGKKQQDDLLRELRMKKERYKQELQSKLRESLPAPRQVSPLLKVRVCDGSANAILSVWSPGEEVVDALKEGACVSLRNVIAAGKRGCELQLTARRCALFNPGTMPDASYPVRLCASFRQVGSPEFSPPYGEFDTVGLVCAVGTAPYSMKDFEAVHLACPRIDSSGSLYLSILFWQGIASYGYAEVLTVGSIVACNNLDWRRMTSWNVPVAYCTDRSTFTRNPRRNHLYESFESLCDSITNPIAYAEGCTAELNVELQKKPATMRTPTRYASDKNIPIKIYNSVSGSDKRPVDHTPSPSLSTPRSTAANNSWNFSTNSPLIQKRLDKLQQYGEPPELSPIIMKSSKRVFLDYRSPVGVSDASSTTITSSTSKHGRSNPCLSPEKQ